MSKTKTRLFLFLIVTFIIFLGPYLAKRFPLSTPPVVIPSATITDSTPGPVLGSQIGLRTKDSGCLVKNQNLPDSDCTPGAVFSEATRDKICVKGYTQTVRNVPASVKNAVYAEYGISSHVTGEYEVDHLVSLELGGSNDIANLWPEPADPRPGFHEKDKVENYLNHQVCSGQMDLATAQQIISSDWTKILSQLP